MNCKSITEESVGFLLADHNQQILSVTSSFTCLTGLTIGDIQTWSVADVVSQLTHSIHGITVSTVPMYDQNSQLTHQAVIVQRANVRKRLEAKLQHLAYHDPLTNLPNRTCLSHCMDAIIKRARTKGQLAGVLFIDLDRFKSINDTMGHAIGDLLLKEAAQRMQACLRPEDRIARMGGDEFICIISDLNDQDQAVQIAETINKELSAPFFLQEHELFITTSIGISLYPYHGDDIETLIANADTAMYQAKHDGRNGYQVYAYEMNAMSFEKMLLEQSLRKAIAQDELRLYYQPQIDIATNRVIGLEALVRWQHPEFGLIPPVEFIPIAEETGLIIPLGYWTLQTACEQNKAWQESGFATVKVSVNLSAHQFRHPDFVPEIKRILADTQLDPKWLELEITESVFIQDVTHTITKLNQLKEMGISIAVDDFGTGYSSLNYLRQFPLDVVKIDRTFIQEITHNPSDQAITDAVIKLAHDLQLKVVAEGVETREQLERVSQPKCDVVQGFLFSAPLPAKHIENWLS